MKIERRGFIRMALACSAASALSAKYPKYGFGQVSSLALANVAPGFYNSLLSFGTKVLPDAASSDLFEDWLAARSIAPSPPAQTISQQWDPPAIHQPTNSGTFEHQTRLSDRTLVVNTHPHILKTTDATSGTHNLNGAELDELGNQNNPLLWRYQCTCLIRLPITDSNSIEPRHDPSPREEEDFSVWLYEGGIPPMYRNQFFLDYVRRFCGCEGLPLQGFGYRDIQYMNGKRGRFAIVQA